MLLHEHPIDFKDLQELTADYIGIPPVAVERDYYIVMLLEKLARSPYANNCVFKGGTSLSKCYPGSIERFSEDIDLTFLPQEQMGNKQYDRRLKQVERAMTSGLRLEKLQVKEMTATRVPMYGLMTKMELMDKLSWKLAPVFVLTLINQWL